MSRAAELQARLGPWATLNPSIDYDTCPDDVWQRYLEQADQLVANNRKWFKIGLARAANELKAKKADGKPKWATREELITFLLSINAPN